jgi:hypothetical protein
LKTARKNLDDGQKALDRQLLDAGRMNILFSKRGELPGSYAWGIDALDKGIENDTCSVHLYFNLEYERHSSESIIRNVGKVDGKDSFARFSHAC